MKEMGKFTYEEKRKDEAVCQSKNILEALRKSSRGRVVTVNEVIFPCFFITE